MYDGLGLPCIGSFLQSGLDSLLCVVWYNVVGGSSRMVKIAPILASISTAMMRCIGMHMCCCQTRPQMSLFLSQKFSSAQWASIVLLDVRCDALEVKAVSTLP